MVDAEILVGLDAADDPLRVLRLSQQNQQPANTEPQRVRIPSFSITDVLIYFRSTFLYN